MSLADGRPIRKDQPTGERCQKVVRREGQGWRVDEVCGAALHEVTTLIPAEIPVTICPTCDVVKLE